MFRKMGNRFVDTCNNDKYILAQCSPYMMVLICVAPGNRFSDSVEVENPDAISAKEWYKICRYTNRFEMWEPKS